MKKGVILYRSKYGATKKYASWLEEATGFDCIETPNATVDAVKQYETIILCGGIYASGIAGLSFLKKNMEKLKGSKILVFCPVTGRTNDIYIRCLRDGRTRLWANRREACELLQEAEFG